MHYKAQYHSLCRRAGIPIQAQAFWWDAVCGKEGWGLSAVEGKEGGLVAAMPYRVYRRRGLKYLSIAPPLATYGYFYTEAPKTNRLQKVYARRKSLTLALLKQLPAVDVVHFNLYPGLEEILAFRQMKWACRQRMTYVFDAPDASLIHARMASSARNHLRRARQSLRCEQGGAVEDLSAFYEDVFRRRKLHRPVESSLPGRLRAALEEEGRGVQLTAFLPCGKSCAACLLVWDEARLHFLISGQSEEGRTHRAMYLLIWEAIKLAARKGLSFDFDGSMMPEVEPVFRSFGARQQPYLNVFAPLSLKGKWLYFLSNFR